MYHHLENEYLRLVVSEVGAELWELERTDLMHQPVLWDGTPSIWPKRAPICFPWCGKVQDGWLSINGRQVQAQPHGFIHDRVHELKYADKHNLEYQLVWNGDSQVWPWKFVFTTLHELKGKEVITTCKVKNIDKQKMPYQIGFHTGLICPFTKKKTLSDYQLRFERPEPSLNTAAIAVSDLNFDNGRRLLTGLLSNWIQIEEQKTGRFLRIQIGGFPYVLLWSKPGIPGFLCIEIWTGLAGTSHDILTRPGIRFLDAGETISSCQVLTVGYD